MYCGSLAELRRADIEVIEEPVTGEKVTEGRVQERETVTDSRTVAMEAEDRSSRGEEMGREMEMETET